MTDAPDTSRPSEEGREALPEPPTLTFRYTNWRGETSMRRVMPFAPIRWGATEWHPEPQWLMSAIDLDKGETRDFALRDCDFAALSRAPTPPPRADGKTFPAFAGIEKLLVNADDALNDGFLQAGRTQIQAAIADLRAILAVPSSSKATPCQACGRLESCDNGGCTYVTPPPRADGDPMEVVGPGGFTRLALAVQARARKRKEGEQPRADGAVEAVVAAARVLAKAVADGWGPDHASLATGIFWDALDAMQSAIARLDAAPPPAPHANASGWQPIETAPKMQAILLYASGYHVGHFNTTNDKWRTITNGEGTPGERLLNSWNPPTAWAPLLDAPDSADLAPTQKETE